MYFSLFFGGFHIFSKLIWVWYYRRLYIGAFLWHIWICKLILWWLIYNGWTITQKIYNINIIYYICGVIVNVLDPRSGQTKDQKIGICCFSAKHAALRRKSKDWLARKQDNVSEWSDMPIGGLLFQIASTIKIQLSMLV